MRQSMFLIVFLVLPLDLGAQSAPQAVVVSGLDSLITGRCEDAVREWTRTWTGADGAKAQQLIASCGYLNSMGQLHGYDLVRTLDVTPYLQRVYSVLRYELSPVYIMILAYAPDGTDWKINTVNWNTDPDKVFPPEMLPPQHPGT